MKTKEEIEAAEKWFSGVGTNESMPDDLPDVDDISLYAVTKVLAWVLGYDD